MANPVIWEAARSYAERGWRVAPAYLGVKYPKIKDWPTAATADPDRVARWFPHGLAQNCCIVTGRESGIWVLDVDTKEGKVGAQTLAALVAAHGPLPDTYTVRTWSGGLHYYFSYDGVPYELRNTTGKRGKSALGKDLDIRAEGGQVVAASSCAEDRPYMVINEVDVAAAPGWLVELLKPPQDAPVKAASADISPERMIRIGEQALSRACLDIRVAQGGEQNDTVNSCAYTIGRLVARGCISETAARDALIRACDAAGHDPARTRDTVASGLASGMQNPKTPWPPPDRPLRGGGGREPRSATPSDTSDVHAPQVGEWPDEFTDDANGRLFARWAAGECRYVAERGAWVKWDGQRWAFEADDSGPTQTWLYAARAWRVDEVDSDGMTDQQVKDAEKVVAQQAAWRKASLMASGAQHCLKIAQGRPELAAQMSHFDQHGTELNTPGGIIDLETGEVSRPDPAKLHTQITAFEMVDGRAAMWESFLRQTFDGHPEVAEYIQRLAGYSATGVQREAVFPFLHGEGANGKSVLMDVLGRVLGGYSITTPAEFLMAGRSQHEQAIARLAGRRLAVASEVNERDRFDEAKLKNQTGGDVQTGRFMRENSFDFRPTHHLWLHGNHLPRVAAGGHGVWRRLRLIKFLNVMPVERQDTSLADRLVEEEGGQILAWIVAGAVDALTGGLRAPSSVTDWTDNYAAEEDEVQQFLSEKTVTTEGSWVSSDDLYRAFSWWSEAAGEKNPLKKNAFGRRLVGLGYKDQRKGTPQQRGWLNVTIPDIGYTKRD